MRSMKLLSAVLAFSMTIPAATSPIAFAEENDLASYESILDDFNEEYGTSYQFPTPNQLAAIGESTDEMIDFFSSMNESDFYNYLYDAYLVDMANPIEFDQVFTDENYTENEIEMSFFGSTYGTQASYTGTQYYYYRGSSTESFYITASWSYGDGYYRYSPYLSDIGATFTEGCYPYYAPYDSTYSLANSSREMACTFYCTKYVSKYLNQGNYTRPVTFVAGGGDIWGSISL